MAAFLFVNAPPVLRHLGGKWAGPVQPFHSSDAYLQAVIGSGDASQKIIDLLVDLPKEKPLLIFVRERDSGSSLLGMTLAYLAWPRDVQMVIIPGTDCAEQLAAIAPGSVAALAFCDISPPSWVPLGIRLGAKGRLVRLLPLEPSK